MYAIIATGGKQYKVSEGDVIKVEKLDAEPGAAVTFDQVVAISDNGLKVAGDVANSTVSATVMEQGRGGNNVEESETITQLIWGLYPVFLDAGYGPQLFWELSIGEINDLLESYARREERALKKREAALKDEITVLSGI